MSLLDFARDELTRAGYFDADTYGGAMGAAVMKLVEAHVAEEHSGMSSSMAVQTFCRLADFQPLTPLTGADDEWVEVGSGLFQNRRCPHVFRDAAGAYDSEARIFREPNGACFTSSESRVRITFPYTPTREYVDRPGPGGAPAAAPPKDGAAEEVARLREALLKAAAQFDFYEQQHAAKGTADATAKAAVNREMAAMLRAALADGAAP